MTDLKESMSRMLDNEPAAPFIADHVVASARRTLHRRRYIAGMAVVSGIAAAVTGLAIATAGTQTGHGMTRIRIAGSSTTSPDEAPTPMASSSVYTASGSLQIETPSCPAGQLPNLHVEHDQAVNPKEAVAAVDATSPGVYYAVSYSPLDPNQQPADHFLIDGAPSPADAIWTLAWNAPGPAALSILSTNDGANSGNSLGTTGYDATYVGCLPDPN
jgi:hypothetical protein